MLPDDDVVQLYSDARFFVCPSVYEPFGLINLEAMRSAAAASLVGGIDVVVDGETGVLVPPAEPEALAAAVSVLCGDPERAARFGAAGRRRVRVVRAGAHRSFARSPSSSRRHREPRGRPRVSVGSWGAVGSRRLLALEQGHGQDLEEGAEGDAL